jgi:hypothetical protein
MIGVSESLEISIKFTQDIARNSSTDTKGFIICMEPFGFTCKCCEFTRYPGTVAERSFSICIIGRDVY